MNEYITFLEGLVLSTTLIDKKYRDGLPASISLVDINDHSGEEADKTAKPKKRKSSKKMKIGKNGLYSTEDSFIHKWWRSYDDDAESGAPGSSREELTKSRISQLRIRETQLQLIVILEVLALQPLASNVEDAGLGLPAVLPSLETGAAKEKLAKAKKPDHLSTLIDVHIDRLCIWQSVALESSKAPDNIQPVVTGSADQMKSTDNIPRDFCVDVIAPL
jgi:DNA replication regulator SLD3